MFGATQYAVFMPVIKAHSLCNSHLTVTLLLRRQQGRWSAHVVKTAAHFLKTFTAAAQAFITSEWLLLAYVRLGQVRLGYVCIGYFRLVQIRLGEVGWVRLGYVGVGQLTLAKFTLGWVGPINLGPCSRFLFENVKITIPKFDCYAVVMPPLRNERLLVFIYLHMYSILINV